MHPYYKTQTVDYYLDLIDMPTISKSVEDKLYTIEKKYEYNPALLSNDLYGSPDYWWIFIKRNMDLLNDPIFDFKAGLTIYTPSKRIINEIR